MSNSCVNGIIYSWMSPRFRDEVKIFLAKYCHISENFLVSTSETFWIKFSTIQFRIILVHLILQQK